MSFFHICKMEGKRGQLQTLETVSTTQMNPRSGAALAKLEKWARRHGPENLILLEEIPVKYSLDMGFINDTPRH